MIKYFKLYFPIFLLTLFYIVFGILLGSIPYMETSSINSLDCLYICCIIVTILFLIEWVCFIVHAARNKELNNNVFWAMMIYFFNIFVMAYYDFKYVIKVKKVNVCVFVYTIITIISFLVGYFIPKNVIVPSNMILYSDDENISIVVNGYYEKRDDVGQYDLYVSDYIRNINMGVFIYNEEDDTSLFQIMIDREDWINSARENAKMIDSFSINSRDKSIESVTYLASLDNKDYVYHISAVEFMKTGDIINTIIITLDDNYDKYKDEFRKIVMDIKYCD